MIPVRKPWWHCSHVTSFLILLFKFLYLYSLSLLSISKGVVEFSLALFCSKLVAYTFLFWLPYYVRNTRGYNGWRLFVLLIIIIEIGGNCLGSKKSDFLSTFFDVGGIVGRFLCKIIIIFKIFILGGIAAGVISDLLNARAISCTLMLYISVPAVSHSQYYHHNTLKCGIFIVVHSSQFWESWFSGIYK